MLTGRIQDKLEISAAAGRSLYYRN